MPIVPWDEGASGPPGLAATGTITAPENFVDSNVFVILLLIY